MLIVCLSINVFSEDKQKTAPQFKARDLKGQLITSDKLYSTGPSVVYFWHSCCGLNKDQLTLLKEFYAEYKSKGFEIVGVALDGVNKTASVKKAVKIYQMEWINVVDVKNELKEKFGPVFVPAVFIIRKGGAVQCVYNGFESGDDVKQKKEIEGLFGKE